MPRLSEAMKDVISCDKLRGDANNFRSVNFRMGGGGGGGGGTTHHVMHDILFYRKLTR